MTGIRRERTARKTRLAEIKGDGLRAIRDRALLALGMAAAPRRSELVALTVDSIVFRERDLEFRLGATKTGQAGEGVTIAILEGSRLRPKALLLAWLDAVRA